MRRSPGTYHNWFDLQVRQATLESPTHGINDHKFSERSLVYVNWRSPVARVLSASGKASIDPYQNLGLNQSLPFLHVLLSARPFQAQRYARGTHISSWSDRHTDIQTSRQAPPCIPARVSGRAARAPNEQGTRGPQADDLSQVPGRHLVAGSDLVHRHLKSCATFATGCVRTE